MHNELIANAATFLSRRTYCSHHGNCTAELVNHTTFVTANGTAGQAPVNPALIPAVNQLAINGAIGDLAAPVVEQAGDHRWCWFRAFPNPANHAMTWGYLPAYVDADFRLLANDPGGLGTNRQRRAYFLPYRQNGITSVRLGNNADFAFTAALGGCTVYLYSPPGHRPWFCHANAGGVAGNKQQYMDWMFEAVAGVPATNAHVRVFRSAPLININVHPGATGAEVRKRLMLRHNVEWLVAGANALAVRTGHNAWTLHWQTARVMSYDRFGALESIRAFLSRADNPRPTHVQKLTSLAVHDSGVV